MAYVDQRTGRNQRAAVMTVVAVLQGAAIVALVNGLAVHFIKQVPIPNPQTHDIPITMPVPIPPPPPKPPIDPRTRPDDPIPHQLLVPTGPVTQASPVPLPPDPVPTQRADPIPLPLPTPPTATQRAPKPRNAPASWATTNDYPARDLREGNQGVTRFTLTIGADGRVEACAITGSSGYPGLDKATCDNVSHRARFEPATDGSGSRTGGSYAGAIHWVIPQD